MYLCIIVNVSGQGKSVFIVSGKLIESISAMCPLGRFLLSGFFKIRQGQYGKAETEQA